MKHDEYHRQFADRVIEQIRQGTAPWQKPWGPGERVLPANVDTGRSYAGGNSLHLAAVQQERGYGDVRWGTYRQIQARGGQVRKGEQGTRILSFQDHRRIAVTDERGRPVRDNEGKRVYRHERMRAPVRPAVHRVQRRAGRRAAGPAHTHCRAALEGPPAGRTGARRQRGPRPSRGGRPGVLQPEPRRDRAPRTGAVPLCQPLLPDRAPRAGAQHGPPGADEPRHARRGDQEGFGSPAYAKEELRAEISAMMTGERVGVGHDPSRGAAYVEGWVAALEEDPREIRRAAADAQKISDFVLARSREREPEREPAAVAATRAPDPQHAARPELPLPLPKRNFGPGR